MSIPNVYLKVCKICVHPYVCIAMQYEETAADTEYLGSVLLVEVVNEYVPSK